MQGWDSRQMRAQTPSILPSHSRYATQEFSGVRKCTRCRLQASSYYDQAPHTHNLPRTIRIEKESFISSCPLKHSSSWPYPGTPSTCSCVACLLIKFQSVFQTPKNSQYPTNAIHGLYVRCCLLAFSIFVAMPTRTSL